MACCSTLEKACAQAALHCGCMLAQSSLKPVSSSAMSASPSSSAATYCTRTASLSTWWSLHILGGAALHSTAAPAL